MRHIATFTIAGAETSPTSLAELAAGLRRGGLGGAMSERDGALEIAATDSTLRLELDTEEGCCVHMLGDGDDAVEHAIDMMDAFTAAWAGTRAEDEYGEELT